MQWTVMVICKQCGFEMSERHIGYGDCDPADYRYMTSDECPVCKRVKAITESISNKVK